MRDGFVFYRSFYESAKALGNDDRLALYEAIFELALNQKETKTEPMVNAFMNLIKPQIEANNRKFENGKKGGRPRKTEEATKPNDNQTETKVEPKEKVKEKEKEKEPSLIPADIINAYKENVSTDRTKIDESWTMKELRTIKHDYQQIINGLVNYGKKVKGSDAIQKLSNFISNRIYLDYQEEQEEKVMEGLLYKGNLYA